MTSGPYERLWERLLEFLEGWAAVEEVAPDRTRVTFQGATGGTRDVTIAMSRDDWDEMVTVPFGDFDSAADEVRRSILAIPPEHTFLVYSNEYDLQSSTTEVLPVEDPFPDGVPRGGAWYACPPSD